MRNLLTDLCHRRTELLIIETTIANFFLFEEMLNVKLFLDQAFSRSVVHVVLALIELVACARTRKVGECRTSEPAHINTYEISSAIKPIITFAKSL